MYSRGRKQKVIFTGSVQSAAAYGIIILAFIGVIAGAIAVSLMGADSAEVVNSYIVEFLGAVDSVSINLKATLIDSVIKYAKILFLLWFSGLAVPGLVVIICLVLFKTFALGFTTAALVRFFGIYGFVIGFSSYYPQNLFFLPAMFFVAYRALLHIHAAISEGGVSARKGGINHAGYAICLFAGLISCFAAALIETYVTPVLIEYIRPI